MGQNNSAQLPDQPHAFTTSPTSGRALVTIGDAGGEELGQAWRGPNAPAQTVP